MQVFQNICDALKGEPTSFGYKTASEAELTKFMDEVALPAWDRDRVRVSDIRKLVQCMKEIVRENILGLFTPLAIKKSMQ